MVCDDTDDDTDDDDDNDTDDDDDDDDTEEARSFEPSIVKHKTNPAKAIHQSIRPEMRNKEEEEEYGGGDGLE